MIVWQFSFGGVFDKQKILNQGFLFLSFSV